MRYFDDNVKRLVWFAPFRSLSISTAYLTPFFIAHGLSTAQVFLLQSVFSVAYLLWEIPSGMIADRLGRAFSIKLSAPIAAIAMIAYGFSGEFWQFVVCELVLALANGLISGIDTALLVDSLAAKGREKEFTRISQRIDGLGFASIAASLPLAILLVHLFGISSTIIADGIVAAMGLPLIWGLVEIKRTNGSKSKASRSAWHAIRSLLVNKRARWLITLRASFNTATYLAFWLASLYYGQLGIPIVLFGAILAVRSLWKAWLSHKFHRETKIKRNMVIYASLIPLVYLGMASGQIWLIWMVLGHDTVQALSNSPLTRRLNYHIDEDHRATMNSVANLIQRLSYTIAGPAVGLLVDHTSLQTGFVVTGIVFGTIAFVAIGQLGKLRVFRNT